MAISSNQVKGRKDWSRLNRPKVRPIQREMWDEDRAVQGEFALQNNNKLAKDTRVDLRHRFSAAGGGKKIGGALGGGSYEPGGSAPTNTTQGTV